MLHWHKTHAHIIAEPEPATPNSHRTLTAQSARRAGPHSMMDLQDTGRRVRYPTARPEATRSAA